VIEQDPGMGYDTGIIMFGLKKNKLVADKSAISKALSRRLEPAGVFPSKEEAVSVLSQRPCRVYLGIDPTGPDIHLGHTIPLLFLKELWQLGHQPIILIGNFTAQVGDPTGKSTARPPLSASQVAQNSRTYTRQMSKILPKDAFKVQYNNDWLGKLKFGRILELASQVTVQQMIQRDMFQERIKREEPIGLHEFLYPLMQGYDSVAMEIDGEVGGSDQIFNMLVGRTLEKKLLNKEKFVFATQLLANAEGRKMSKSEGDIITVDDEPREIRRKVLAMDDGLIKKVFELCTEKPTEWIEANQNKDRREWKEELADELVRMYHGEKAVSLSRSAKEVAGGGKNLAELLSGNLSISRSEAKRLIEQSAVEINGQTAKDWNYQTKLGDKIQVGKGRFIEIK